MAGNPSPNGSNGRDAKGRFGSGNRHGKGNPHARKSAEFRSALLDGVTRDDVTKIAKKLVEMAKGGDIQAIKELLSRLVGPPVSLDILERIKQVEDLLANEVDEHRAASG